MNEKSYTSEVGNTSILIMMMLMYFNNIDDVNAKQPLYIIVYFTGVSLNTYMKVCPLTCSLQYVYIGLLHG